MSDVAYSVDIDEFMDDMGRHKKMPSGKRRVSSREKTHVKEEKKDGKVVFFKVIAILFMIFLGIEAVIYAFLVPCFGIPRVEYKGLETISSDLLEEKLEPMATDSWNKFNPSRAVALLSTVSGIESVSVDKKFPDQVVISVRERVAVANSIVFENGRSKSVQIDENGVVFTANSDALAQDTSIPLVTGIPSENLVEGMRLPSKYRVLMEQISQIRSLPQKYFAVISEIQIVPKEFGNYELALYPAFSKVRVLTDPQLNEDAIKCMMVVLDVVNSIEADVSEVDLRYGSVSYKKNRASTEESIES
ncbi:MAG: FtsQ-type POTRA domain-containing protein [Treponema sp.]|nr:FtsQ-type POTRA domain-containing protein [Spirochaetia bacterium]MCI7440119.1 FtsQ-type POTRA domain-containing protein [Spirochaetia bacterium]MEE0892408.1 FtsQ-type POTRA domain-containing protein [Treponema sp.]